MAMAFAPAAHAINWRFEPSVYGTATLTDNVNQSESDRKDALILTLTPGFLLRSEGSRKVQASLQYGLSGVKRFGGDQGDDLFHNLSAIGKAELVDDFLFIDGSANVSQQLISLLGSPAEASTNSSNRATVGSYSISPYILKRLGTFARGMVRYTQSGAIFQNNAANNINANSLSATLTSGTEFTDFSWGLDYMLRNATIQGTQDTRFEHYGASMGYVLTRHVRVFGTVGHDSNDFTATPGTGISGGSWTAGLGWSPSRRTSMDASFGNSFFGRTYGFNFNHRTQYSIWTASYSEGVSDMSQLLFSTQAATAWLCDGSLIFGTGTLQPPGYTSCTVLAFAPSGIPIGIANGVFISDILRGGAAWSKGRSSLGLDVFDVRRRFLQLPGIPADETRGIVANYGYRLQPHTTLNANLAYTNNLVPAGLGTIVDRDDNLYTASIGISHQFDPKLSGTLTLRRQQRISNISSNDFDENSITASAFMSF